MVVVFGHARRARTSFVLFRRLYFFNVFSPVFGVVFLRISSPYLVNFLIRFSCYFLIVSIFSSLSDSIIFAYFLLHPFFPNISSFIPNSSSFFPNFDIPSSPVSSHFPYFLVHPKVIAYFLLPLSPLFIHLLAHFFMFPIFLSFRK